MSKVTATYSGFVGHEGVPVLLHDGDEYDSDHSLVQARPELFTEPPAAKRTVLRGKGKAAAEEPAASPDPAPGKGKATDG